MNISRTNHSLLAGNGLKTTSSPDAKNYGSRELSKEVYAVAAAPITIPSINRDYLRATASTRGSSGEPEVREYAGNAFEAANAQLDAESRRLTGEVKVELGGAERHIRELSAVLHRTPRYSEEARDGVPWTRWDRVQVVFFAFLSIILLGVGINTNAVVLLSSGIPGFESPLRAYLFSMIPIALAAAVKAPASFFTTRRHLTVYTLIVWTLGLLFGFWWASLFADTFPGLTQSAADIVNSLTQSQSSAETDPHSTSLVYVAMSAEVFLAAGCWLTIQAICDKHQGWTRTESDAYLCVQRDLDAWSQRRNVFSKLAGSLEGKLREIAEARSQFVGDTLGLYRAAVKLAANDGQLGDYLNR